MSDFDDYVPLRRFQPTLALSPDGRDVACSTNDSGRYDLWVRPVDGGPARQLTDLADRTVRGVAYSPDGSMIAFEADEHGDEQLQIHVVPATGGEARRLTSATDRQHGLADRPFSPDGTMLVYDANDRDPSVQDVVLHDLATGATRRVESRAGELLHGGSVSPDGRLLLVTGLRSNTDARCYLVDLADPALALRPVPAPDGEALHVAGPWAPDSASFLVRTDAGAEFTHAVRRVVDGADCTVELSADWGVEDVVTSADGRVTAWAVNVDGASELHVTRNGEPVAVPELPAGVVTSLTLAADGSTLAFLHASTVWPTDLVVVDLTTGELRRLTDSRPPGLTAVEPVQPELIRYPTHDGKDVPAWLYRPAGDGPFPVVLSIHGGPESQERPGYAYSGLYQCLLANGVGVLAPNIRGSSGYGTSYQRLIHHDWGGAELGDLDHAARHLRTLDWVRPDRIGVFGGSFGGFATLSCVSRLPSLWAAGVSIVGPSNLVTFARSVPPTWRPIMAKWIGDVDTEADFLLARSPITYADDIVAPLFVIQGAKDPRVVQAESDQIVEKLRARGVDVRYDVYPDEGHGFTTRANELRAMADVVDFLLTRLA